MARKIQRSAADYIVPLDINGLEGRMLHVPASRKGKNQEILLIYGHHAMLERWWSLVQNLQAYGNVTMPDLPGFGGMDSFEKIGKYPNLDAFADYVAAFIKLRFNRKKISIVGISFGFLVVTRMLQRYPELCKKVNLLVSVVGFLHRDDFIYTRRQRNFYRRGTRVFATRPVARVIRTVAFRRPILKKMYQILPNSKRRMLEVSPEEFEATIDFEVDIWRSNDVRTHWLTTSEFLNIDNCTNRLPLEVCHVVSQQDHYFNNEIVKQHMLVVFKKYHRYTAPSKAHTPSVLADKKAAGVLLPAGLRRKLDKL